MANYTEEQKAIAKQYEAKAFALMASDGPEFAECMAEFEELKKKWDKENAQG